MTRGLSSQLAHYWEGVMDRSALAEPELMLLRLLRPGLSDHTCRVTWAEGGTIYAQPARAALAAHKFSAGPDTCASYGLVCAEAALPSHGGSWST